MNNFGQTEELEPMPAEDEAATAPEATPPVNAATAGNDALAKRAQAKYTGPEERCGLCNNFNGDDKCNLGWPAEPEGHCDKFTSSMQSEGEGVVEELARGGAEEEDELPPMPEDMEV